MKILVTGATGYVGGRLVPRLLEAGHTVRVLVRDVTRLEQRMWADDVQVVEGDLLKQESLMAAFAGIDVAFYLVHAMHKGGDYAKRDRDAACHFVEAGQSVSTLKHVVYLGGLQPEGQASKHLRSRAEVGEILREGLPTTEFRAGPIIGSGSASFEMVRYLTERLVAMISPKWVKNTVQPIAIRDVLAYLLAACEREPVGVLDIGADVLRFDEMMQGYARVRGLRRRIIIKVPVLAPGLAARWVGLVTPINNQLAVPLVRGMTKPLVSDVTRSRTEFPDIHPIDYEKAVELALGKIERGEVETRWTMAMNQQRGYQMEDREGVIREQRMREVNAPAEEVYRVVTGLGGERGWLAWNWAWKLRGLLDQMIGGPGLRRGRRDADELLQGETLDWWRVESVVPNKLMRLRAEMKVPGKAWLEYSIKPLDDGHCRLKQTALFAPRGMLGPIYWYVLLPLHFLIFKDLINAIARDAEQLAGND